jgi:penicillin amidase
MRIVIALLGIPSLLVAQSASFDSLARRSLATIDGSLGVRGVRDTVRVIRDQWGVPHIYAKNVDDLFFAQGFVQAQDRLWQMDMYRRMYEGRLAEILGPSYVAHDRLARLVKFRGPYDQAELGSYHPEGKRILQAFANGVNAFIAQAGDNLPVEYKLTGLRPLPWTIEASLVRTQTAMPIADARAELELARSAAQLGLVEANRRADPHPWGELTAPKGVDLAIIGDAAIAPLRALREGTVRPALLPEYERWRDALPNANRGAQESSPGSNNWVVSGSRTASGKVIVANDPHRNVANPSIRYIVHLNAPGWNMIGATEPVLPGVAIGHNGQIAWGLTIVGTDQADVYVEQVNPANRRELRWQNGWEARRVVRDTIRVKGAAPVIVDLEYSRHGPIFYDDTVHHVAYAMRSTMYEPGTAGYLGALRYHDAHDCGQFLDRQVYWKAPTENMICGDTAGNIAWQGSALSPRRAGWDGRLPVSGTGAFEWTGFRNDLPRELNPSRGWIATANHDIHPPGYSPPLFFKQGNQGTRYERLADVLSKGSKFTIADFQRLQHDAYSAAAAKDLARFRGWTASDPAVERGRAMLAGWKATYARESAAAALYGTMSRTLARDTTSSHPALERIIAAGLDTLRARQGADPAQWRWGRINRSELPHSLVGAYDIPAIERAGGAGTVAAIGATYREIIDLGDLDASVATNVPGQSGQPGSPYYANLARSFADQQYFPLAYSRPRVEEKAAHRLTLVPSR